MPTTPASNVVAAAGRTLAGARRPFYASLGASQRVATRARELPTISRAAAPRVHDQVRELPAQVRELPAQVRALRLPPAEVTTAVRHLRAVMTERVDAWQGHATEVYGDLIEQGEAVYRGWRGTPVPASPVVRVVTEAPEESDAPAPARRRPA
jgi:hypothetical protein